MLRGKIIIKGEIKVLTGLRIGGSSTGLKIGGVDLNVITDAENKPYIPGSSLKGKMRSLLERKLGKIEPSGKVHYCKEDDKYNNCPVCKIFGISPTEKDSEIKGFVATRLFVRDTKLDEKSITQEMHENIDLKWTEIKTENVINRIKGSAESPRQIERVPAGAIFRPMEMVFNIFEENDKDLLKVVFETMELLEDDYLGGMGSRGYGKVKFENIEIYWNKKEDYEAGTFNEKKINDGLTTPKDIVKNFDSIKGKIV